MSAYSVRRLPHDATAHERLMARRRVDDNGCWVYAAALGRDGYGTITIFGRTEGVHRASYREYVGPIAPGLTIDHLCRNRACFNPAHLEAVSHSENCRRRVAAAAEVAA